MTLLQDVLIVAMPPTPNGSLHIGHGGGTYLRADILARALTLTGHRVTVITGSDVFENWVVAAAVSSGQTPDEVCDRYHAENERDLRLLGMGLDLWIDPRAAGHHAAYVTVHENALRVLRATGAAALETELIPHTADTGQPRTGTWIAGRCPHCSAPVGGGTCTACGAGIAPAELQDLRSRLDDRQLVLRPVENWFTRPRDPRRIVDRLAAELRPHVLAPAARHLDHLDHRDDAGRRAGRIRLTGHGDWGVHSPLAGPGRVLSNHYYLYAAYCGLLYGGLLDGKLPALAPASDSGSAPGTAALEAWRAASSNPFTAAGVASTIGVFGHDNSVPGLVVPHVIADASGGAYRPFDEVAVHGMLTLGGRKCSTSQRYGIWLADLLGIASADEVRYALSEPALDAGTADLSIQEMAAAVNEHRAHHRQAYVAAQQLPLGAAADPVGVLAWVSRQHAHMVPGRLDVPAARAVLADWLRDTSRPPADWLLGLALLGEPIIPDLAARAWTQLGHSGRPSLAAAGRLPAARPVTVITDVEALPLDVTRLTDIVRNEPQARGMQGRS